MNAKQKEKWEKIRAKGQARYVLVQGILIFGTSFAVSCALVKYLLKYGFTFAHANDYLASAETIFKFHIYSIFFGLAVGNVIWRNRERAFNKPR